MIIWMLSARTHWPAQCFCSAAYSSWAICSAVGFFTGMLSAHQICIGAPGWSLYSRAGKGFCSAHWLMMSEDAIVEAMDEASSAVTSGVTPGATGGVTGGVRLGATSPVLGKVEQRLDSARGNQTSKTLLRKGMRCVRLWVGERTQRDLHAKRALFA